MLRTSYHILSFKDSDIFVEEGTERLQYKPEVAYDYKENVFQAQTRQ